MPQNSEISPRDFALIAAKITAVILFEFCVIAFVLFFGAGTVRWEGGWLFLLLVTVSIIPAIVALVRHDPALVEARTQLAPKGQPLADRLFVPLHTLMMLLWAAMAGYDSVRHDWTHVPMALRVAAAFFIPVATWMGYQTMRQNPFLTTCVHVQSDRGHRVVDTGAYAIVRHPFYAVTIGYQLCASLVLGSWLSFALALVIAGMVALRVCFEERLLERELAGYAAYKQRTPWRLVPGVW